MSELKTKPNDGKVIDFLNTIEPEKKKTDSLALLTLFKEVTNEEAIMWGGSIVGFGTYHYKYKTGREGDWFCTGFSPRKQNLTLYIMSGFSRYDELLKQLGKHKIGKSCLYINKLEDVDLTVLKQLIKESIEYISTKEWS